MKATRRPGKGLPPRSRSPHQPSAWDLAEERQLVEAAQKDPAQFDALYELHFERVYAFIASRTQDRATAEDLTSEVFHKALANLSRFEWRGVPFSAWLLRIAANAVVDHTKRSRREGTGLELPEMQRQVVHHRFVEQLSIREIASRLGKTEGAIKQLQLRALEKLRAQMGGGHA